MLKGSIFVRQEAVICRLQVISSLTLSSIVHFMNRLTQLSSPFPGFSLTRPYGRVGERTWERACFIVSFCLPFEAFRAIRSESDVWSFCFAVLNAPRVLNMFGKCKVLYQVRLLYWDFCPL